MKAEEGEHTVYAEFDTKIAQWGTSQGARIPKSAMEKTQQLATGTILHAEVGCDDDGEYLLMRPSSKAGSPVTLGLARKMGMARDFSDADFDALDDEIAAMFEDGER
jgi:antitoxin component of MazEF toxin-antitoxin module